jgi:hypothetical protein
MSYYEILSGLNSIADAIKRTPPTYRDCRHCGAWAAPDNNPLIGVQARRIGECRLTRDVEDKLPDDGCAESIPQGDR